MIQTTTPIVILANSSWGFVHQREHELAKEFARLGHSVYYIEEMPSLASAARRWIFPNAHKKLSNPVPEGITVLQPPMCLTYFRSSLVPRLDSYQMRVWLKMIVERYSLGNCLLLYSFSYWFYLDVLPGKFNSAYSVFDYSDDESVYARNQTALRRLEKGSNDAASEVNLVLYTSRGMENRSVVRHARVSLLLRNAVSREFTAEPLERLRTKGEKIHVGYVGVQSLTVIDAALLKRIEEDERWTLWLAGLDNPDLTRQFTRSVLKGVLNRRQVIAFIDQSDVCILPFTINERTSVADPLTMYEYSARGKPVVAMRTKALEPYEDILYLSASHDEFLRNIARALNENDAGKREKRIEFARRNTWEGRVAQLMNNIQ